MGWHSFFYCTCTCTCTCTLPTHTDVLAAGESIQLNPLHLKYCIMSSRLVVVVLGPVSARALGWLRGARHALSTGPELCVVELAANEEPGRNATHVVLAQQSYQPARHAACAAAKAHWLSDTWLEACATQGKWVEEGPHLLGVPSASADSCSSSSSSSSSSYSSLPASAAAPKDTAGDAARPTKRARREAAAPLAVAPAVAAVPEPLGEDWLAVPDWTVTLCGRQVSALGMGVMPLCVDYPNTRPSRGEALVVLHAALEVGVRFFDTADTYCRDGQELHYGEALVAEAVRTWKDGAARAEVVVATKGGMTRLGSKSNSWRNFVSPAQLKTTIVASAAALGGAIDVWQLHHPPESKKHSLASCIEVAAQAVADGLVRAVGLCNASRAEVEEAAQVVPLALLQDKLSIYELQSQSKAAKQREMALQYCTRKKIPFAAYGVLGGTPRRQRKLRSVSEAFPVAAAMARGKGVSTESLLLAYLKHRYPCVLHIPGARTAAHVKDSSSAKTVRFTRTDMSALDMLRPGRKGT
eukprot:g77129.t1